MRFEQILVIPLIIQLFNDVEITWHRITDGKLIMNEQEGWWESDLKQLLKQNHSITLRK